MTLVNVVTDDSLVDPLSALESHLLRVEAQIWYVIGAIVILSRSR